MNVGEMVVCMETSKTEQMGLTAQYDVAPRWPVVGEVYMVTNNTIIPNGDAGISLSGFHCKHDGTECGFSAKRFKPQCDVTVEERIKLLAKE